MDPPVPFSLAVPFQAMTTNPVDAAAHTAIVHETGERIMRALYPEVETVGLVGEIVSGSASFLPQPEHVGAPGWVQGGLSATVLDYLCARMASAALGMKVATGTLDLRYRQPVLLDGGPYRVEGTTEQPRSKTVRVSGAILSSEGRPLIEATGLFVGVAPQA